MTSLTLIEEYWEEYPGRIRERYCVDVAGIRQGLYESWRDNGQRWEQYEYVNGNLHGLSQYWRNNGQLELQVEYVDGKCHGMSTYYYNSNGLVQNRRWYEKGIQLVWVGWYNKVSIVLSRNQSIDSGVFLSRVISELVTEGREYDITYFG
jgi:antitoxin component YwqK of YwqJK toxin-antitoxin module